MRSDINLSKLINYSNLEFDVSLPSTRKLQLIYLAKTAARSFKKNPIRVMKKILTKLPNI